MPELRADSVKVARPHPAGRGGSIPASALFFQWGCVDAACALVKKYHYSRRVPSGIMAVGSFHREGGLFGDKGDCVAACVFSTPPTRWSEPVLELSRLVRQDGIRVPLTKLIGQTVFSVKRAALANLLVSFADSTQGHHGGIYQASSWNYHGKRARAMDGLMVDGAFVPGRTCNARFNTRSPGKVATLLGAGHSIKPHYDEGKHLYWKAINRHGRRKAQRLGLVHRHYPKPKLLEAPDA